MAEVKVNKYAKEDLDKLSKKIGKGAVLRVGFLEGAKYPDGTPVAYVAALANYGHGPTPARPFFQNFIEWHVREWPGVLEAALSATDNDLEAALRMLGEHMKGGLQEQIIKTNTPPLSKITLWLRKWKRLNPGQKVTGSIVGQAAAAIAAGEDVSGENQKVLIETSHMLNSVDYEVKMNG